MLWRRCTSLLLRSSSSLVIALHLHSATPLCPLRRRRRSVLVSCTRAPRLCRVSPSHARTPLSPVSFERAPPFLALLILVSSLSVVPHCLCLCLLLSAALQLRDSATPATPLQLQDCNSISFSSTPLRLQPCLLNSVVPPFLSFWIEYRFKNMLPISEMTMEIMTMSPIMETVTQIALSSISLQTMEKLVASLPAESQKLGLEDKSNGTDNRRRSAPLAGLDDPLAEFVTPPNNPNEVNIGEAMRHVIVN
ncbi:hypothetical protein PIB30_012093 [Stylosanthes scabra]|uniref:Uncharacterized protein n=1 Tax=Stylosanthes scabra TaxID=79078 RepID=A0ABU6R5N7_9FABA|nr:hypothetical protein [Stylosanthes scabra]